MEKKDWKKKLRELSFMKGYYFKLEDNGLVEKKDDQLVFRREELEYFISQELDKAREEGKLEYILSLGWQDTDNEYVKEVLEDAERIAEKLSKLKESERELEQEIEKAREEGREEGINAVLFPKFKRDKNGTLKREGWVNTSKLRQ